MSPAIEVGHVFKLGTKYSEAMNARFLDSDGREKPFIMGCYGIGVNRILASAVEEHHDEAGIIWPVSMAPCEAVIVSVDESNERVKEAAERLYGEAQALGIEVLYDDRDVRPGVKFKDADLVGFPLRITVGERHLKDGRVEMKRRDSKDLELVPVGEAAGRARGLLSEMLAELEPR